MYTSYDIISLDLVTRVLNEKWKYILKWYVRGFCCAIKSLTMTIHDFCCNSRYEKKNFDHFWKGWRDKNPFLHIIFTDLAIVHRQKCKSKLTNCPNRNQQHKLLNFSTQIAKTWKSLWIWILNWANFFLMYHTHMHMRIVSIEWLSFFKSINLTKCVTVNFSDLFDQNGIYDFSPFLLSLSNCTNSIDWVS